MKLRRVLECLLPPVTAFCVLVELLSLRLGWLNRFFFGAAFADVQGYDYFSLPRAWINLTQGRSAYNTFNTAYGPHATWYLSHPALAVWLGSLLSLFRPWTSYGVFVIFSLLCMGASAWLVARESPDALRRRSFYFLFLCAFPTFWMLYVGNVQALLVLALTLILAGLVRMTEEKRGSHFVAAGLLLSLFTKPIVLLLLPLFLLLRETRKRTAQVLAVYTVVSLAFEFLRPLNPQAIPFRRVMWLELHPAWVQGNMNIYTNGFVLTPPMLDNSIHWLNLVAQSGTRMEHVDVMSLPVFVDSVLSMHTPGWLYLLPALTVLALSFFVARQRIYRARMSLALMLVCAASVSFFLTYNTVWEYQYTILLPVAAVLLLLPRDCYPDALVRRLCQAFALCAWLPSLFFLVEVGTPDAFQRNLIRFDRVVPATLLFVCLVAVIVLQLRELRSQSQRPTGVA